MAVYTVHRSRRDTRSATQAKGDEVTFVREGIAWFALLFALPWLLLHRLWLAAFGYVVAAALLIGFVPEVYLGFAAILMNLAIALEGDSLRRWSLAQKGYEMIDVVAATSRQSGEQRFFDRWGPGVSDRIDGARSPSRGVEADAPGSIAMRGTLTSAARSRPIAGDDDVIGLFPQND